MLSGRPVLHALGAGGRAGVAAWLQSLHDDLTRTMVLLGARHPQELRDALG